VPQRRAGDPTPVQRKCRQQVEREQHEVGVAEPGDDPVDRGREAHEQAERGQQPADEERDERTGDGDPELRPSRRELALERRHASEQP